MSPSLTAVTSFFLSSALTIARHASQDKLSDRGTSLRALQGSARPAADTSDMQNLGAERKLQ